MAKQKGKNKKSKANKFGKREAGKHFNKYENAEKGAKPDGKK